MCRQGFRVFKSSCCQFEIKCHFPPLRYKFVFLHFSGKARYGAMHVQKLEIESHFPPLEVQCQRYYARDYVCAQRIDCIH